MPRRRTRQTRELISGPIPDPARHPFASLLVRGRETDLYIDRRGAGRPVVLLHGLADDHRLWRLVAPCLAERYDTIAVDLPGRFEAIARRVLLG